MKIAIDSAIAIYALNSDASLHEQAIELIKYAPIKGYELHASELLYLEILSAPNIVDADARAIRDAVAKDLSVNWPIDDSIILKAAELRRKYRYETPDAIHLATAIERKNDYFVTNDKDLLKTNAIEGLQIIGLANIAKHI